MRCSCMRYYVVHRSSVRTWGTRSCPVRDIARCSTARKYCGDITHVPEYFVALLHLCVCVFCKNIPRARLQPRYFIASPAVRPKNTVGGRCAPRNCSKLAAAKRNARHYCEIICIPASIFIVVKIRRSYPTVVAAMASTVTQLHNSAERIEGARNWRIQDEYW